MIVDMLVTSTTEHDQRVSGFPAVIVNKKSEAIHIFKTGRKTGTVIGRDQH